MKKPSIILADEPTASLDSSTAEDIMSLLEELNRELCSICIVATHDKRIVDSIGDRIRLEDGNERILNRCFQIQGYGLHSHGKGI